MASVTVTVRMVPLPVMAQVEVLAAVARVVAQVPEAVSLQIALDAVIVMKSEELAPYLSSVAVLKLSTKLVGVVPATKVFGTADVQVTDPALVDTSVDTNSKARKIIVGGGWCWCGEWSWSVSWWALVQLVLVLLCLCLLPLVACCACCSELCKLKN